MTIISLDRDGLSALSRHLCVGIPFVVPLSSPLPYVVAGTSPAAVNLAKGRPRAQPVGVAIQTLDLIEPALELDPETISLVRWLCFAEEAGVLVPVDDSAPAWLGPATVDGMAFLGGAWLPELSVLVTSRTHLYMSSANATASQPATTAAEAEAAFGGEFLVVDGDAFRDPSRAHGSSTMITVGRGGLLKVIRPGINNLAFGDDHDRYLDDLRRRWRHDQPRT
jgi:tRNA A37 threonylcarbamoyladenosine synthetase subunit TsaC/SUA5/YrdC